MTQPHHINYFALPGLKERGQKAIRPRVDKEIIINTVCEYFEIHRWQIESALRTRKFTLPRQVAFYFLRQNTSMTFKATGELLNRDHTTVIHSVEVVENLCATDSEFKDQLNEVGDKILENAIKA